MNKLVSNERTHSHKQEESKEWVKIDTSHQKATTEFELDLE